MDSEIFKLSEEEESEKLKEELKRIGIDEPNSSFEDMKEMMLVVNESLEMANAKNNGKNQKSSSFSNNSVTDVNVKRESLLEKKNEQPKPSCSYKTRNSSSEVPNLSKKHNKSRTMVESDISDNDISKHQTPQWKKQFVYSKQKLMRWRINPLESHSDQNDVPLQQPNRPQAQERIPFRFCKGVCNIEKSNEVMGKLSIHLKKMADLWHSAHGSTQTKFQWGTPIQVDATNNSSNRKPLMVVSNSNEIGNINTNYNRTSKRKAWTTNTASSSSSSDDDNVNISLNFLKKQKLGSANKLSKKLHNEEQITEDTDHLKHELNKKNLFLNNNDTDVNNKKTDNKTVNVKIQQEPNKRVVSSDLVLNPRRMKPLKTNMFDKSKAQSSYLYTQRNESSINKNLEKSPVTSKREMINNTLTDEDISKELEKGSDDNNEAILNEDVVIKPLPMRNVSSRLAKQCALLKQTDAERKNKILAEQREAQKKEEEEKEKRKQDFIRRRMEEIEKTFQKEEEMQRKEKEKDKWLQVLQSRSKFHMQKWKEQDKKEAEKQQRDVVHQDYDNVQIIEEMVKVNNCLEKKVTCPICNKSFPSDKIENHAAMCEQFETDSEHEDYSTYSPQNSKYIAKGSTKNFEGIYECNICSSFKTNNGIEYEDHVNSCIQHKQNSLSEGYTPITINIADSPVRSYQPISEQRNSNIDYSGQLGSVNKAQVGRKRKR